MIDADSCLAVIVARGGSKGLPGKNIADLGGRPLVAWSVDAARGSKYIDRIVLSTDDETIAEAGKAAGAEVPFLRPKELAEDDSPVSGAITHAVGAVERRFSIVALLQATSPFRAAADIDACIEACHGGAPSAVSVSQLPKPQEWLCRLDGNHRLQPIVPGGGLTTRRQDLTPAYVPNGAVYVSRTAWYLEHLSFYGPETFAHVMPPERSVDIDGPHDLAWARWRLEFESVKQEQIS